jgi:chromatin remodeling complex protein RSC6
MTTTTINPTPAEKKVTKRTKSPKVAIVPETVEQPELLPETTIEAVETVDDSDKSSSGEKKRTITRDIVLSSFDEIIKSIEDEIETLREGDSKVKGIKFFKTLNKRLKTLKTYSSRLIKDKKSATSKSANKNSGFLKPVPISKEMAKFTGWNSEELKSRVDVTKFLCNYIRDNNLQNPKDRRQIVVDGKLSKLLKYDAKKETTPLTYYKMQSSIKHHFLKPELTASA